MSFCTVINCMDGRTQIPVIEFARERFGAEYADTITEPGPNGILAGREDPVKVQSILDRIDISVDKHGSSGIVIVGHHDCAGNPTAKDQQLQHLEQAVAFLRDSYPQVEVVSVWVNEDWCVEVV